MDHLDFVIQRPVSAMASRKERILFAASHAFAASGFKGASLRDIAFEAGVSLTLLNHHFGSKQQLLEAVVDHHHDVCRSRLGALRERLTSEQDRLSREQVVEEWVRYEYELYGTSDGEQYLRLMLKLADEPEVGEPLRRKLDCSEAVMLRAFALAFPASSHERRMQAFRSASSALHTGIKDFAESALPEDDAPRQDARDFSVRFILGGIGASLD
jgi:AcrR family transcriptional regulator